MNEKEMKDIYGKSVEKFKTGCKRIGGNLEETKYGLTCENKEGELSLDEEMAYVKNNNNKVGGSLYPDDVGVIVPISIENKKKIEEEYGYSGLQQLVITSKGGRIGLSKSEAVEK